MEQEKPTKYRRKMAHASLKNAQVPVENEGKRAGEEGAGCLELENDTCGRKQGGHQSSEVERKDVNEGNDLDGRNDRVRDEESDWTTHEKEDDENAEMFQLEKYWGLSNSMLGEVQASEDGKIVYCDQESTISAECLDQEMMESKGVASEGEKKEGDRGQRVCNDGKGAEAQKAGTKDPSLAAVPSTLRSNLEECLLCPTTASPYFPSRSMAERLAIMTERRKHIMSDI